MPEVEWKANPKQALFLRSSVFEALYGGAASGGKSQALLMGALRWIGEPSYRALIIRRSYGELAQLVDRSTQWYRANGGTFNKSEHRWTFPSGATIEFGYCDIDGDEQRYSGQEFSYLAIDEAALIDEKPYLFLLSRLRSAVGLPIHVRLGSNPSGPEHWLFKRWRPWLDTRESYTGPRARPGQTLYYVNDDDNGEVWLSGKAEADEMRARYDAAPLAERRHLRRPLSRMFLPALPEDNPQFLARNPGYLDQLAGLDVVTRKRLRDGDWLVTPAAGTYFKRIWFKTPTPLDGQVVNRVRAWDLGSTLDGDWTVGVRMARTRTGGNVIEDVVRIRARPAERDALIVSTAIADGPRCRVVLPQDPGQAGVSQKEAHAKLLGGKGFIVSFIRPTGSKIVRAQPFSAQCEAGTVACGAGAWREPFLACLEGFPDARHDDDVDAAADAYNSLGRSPVTYPDDDWEAPRRWDAAVGGDDDWLSGGNGGGWDSTN